MLVGLFVRGDPAELVEFTASARPGDFGAFAPIVFDHASRGDEVATAIIARAVGFIERSLAVMNLREGEPLCLLGGLAPQFGPLLSPVLQQRLRPPAQDALGGAVSMALRTFLRGGEGS